MVAAAGSGSRIDHRSTPSRSLTLESGRRNVLAFVFVGGLSFAALLAGCSTTDQADEISDLSEAVVASSELLAGSPVEGVQHAYVDGELAAAVWFKADPNGDAFVFAQVDESLTADFSAPGPLGVTTTVTIRLDGTLYEAISSPEAPGLWSSTTPAHDLPLALGLVRISPDGRVVRIRGRQHLERESIGLEFHRHQRGCIRLPHRVRSGDRVGTARTVPRWRGRSTVAHWL